MSVSSTATAKAKSQNLADYPDSTVARVLDGTSNTVLAGERGICSDWWNGPIPDPGNAECGTGAGPECDAYRGGWVAGMTQFPYTTGGWHPDATNPIRDKKIPAGTSGAVSVIIGWRHWGSIHPEGANFVLCDGSVRMIRYAVSPDMFRRVINRQDGEPMDHGNL
jgi:prepilin-type processing-associated H-X9-DG protein